MIAKFDELQQAYDRLAAALAEARDSKDAWEATAQHHYKEAREAERVLAYAASTGDECAIEVEALRSRAENAERALGEAKAQVAGRDLVIDHARRMWDEAEARLGEAEAKIDALMLEWCPDEMTNEQKARWAKNQHPVDNDVLRAVDAHLSHNNLEAGERNNLDPSLSRKADRAGRSIYCGRCRREAVLPYSNAAQTEVYIDAIAGWTAAGDPYVGVLCPQCSPQTVTGEP